MYTIHSWQINIWMWNFMFGESIDSKLQEHRNKAFECIRIVMNQIRNHSNIFEHAIIPYMFAFSLSTKSKKIAISVLHLFEQGNSKFCGNKWGAFWWKLRSPECNIFITTEFIEIDLFSMFINIIQYTNE